MKSVLSGTDMVVLSRNRAKLELNTREIFPGKVVPYLNTKKFF